MNILSDLRPYLTKAECSLVQSELGNVAQVNKLFTILLTKDNKHFEVFCHILEHNGCQHMAQQLRAIAGGGKEAEGRCAELRQPKFFSCCDSVINFVVSPGYERFAT